MGSLGSWPGRRLCTGSPHLFSCILALSWAALLTQVLYSTIWCHRHRARGLSTHEPKSPPKMNPNKPFLIANYLQHFMTAMEIWWAQSICGKTNQNKNKFSVPSWQVTSLPREHRLKCLVPGQKMSKKWRQQHQEVREGIDCITISQFFLIILIVHNQYCTINHLKVTNVHFYVHWLILIHP